MNRIRTLMIYILVFVIILGGSYIFKNREAAKKDEVFIGILIEANRGLALDYNKSQELNDYYYNLAMVNIYAASIMIDYTSYGNESQNLKSFLLQFSDLLMDNEYRELIMSHSHEYFEGIQNIINKDESDIEEIVQKLKQINNGIKYKKEH